MDQIIPAVLLNPEIVGIAIRILYNSRILAEIQVMSCLLPESPLISYSARRWTEFSREDGLVKPENRRWRFVAIMVHKLTYSESPSLISNLTSSANSAVQRE